MADRVDEIRARMIGPLHSGWTSEAHVYADIRFLLTALDTATARAEAADVELSAIVRGLGFPYDTARSGLSECVVAVAMGWKSRAEAAESAIAEAVRERDERPEISVEDAAAVIRGRENASTMRDEDRQKRASAALRAHAAKDPSR